MVDSLRSGSTACASVGGSLLWLVATHLYGH